MIHAYTGQTRGAGARPFLLGLATAAIALIKISDIPGLGVMVLFYIGYAVRARRCLWKDALRYLAGMAVLAVPVLGYLGAVGALGAMFEEYILNNFVHVASAKDAGFWEIRRYLIENGYGWESLKPVLLMAGAVIVRLLIYRGEPERFKREKGLLACAATVAVANMLAAYVSGTGFEQHLAMGDCTLLMACLLALSAVLDRLNRKVRWMKWLEYAAALCVLGVCRGAGRERACAATAGGGQDGARGVCGGPARTFGLSGRGRNGLYHRHMAGLVLVRGPAARLPLL